MDIIFKKWLLERLSIPLPPTICLKITLLTPKGNEPVFDYNIHFDFCWDLKMFFLLNKVIEILEKHLIVILLVGPEFQSWIKQYYDLMECIKSI